MESILVSVLISNFNYGQYIESCIQSALNQTYKNVEVILYDDGSNDNSLEIAKKYEKKIHIISQENYGKEPYINQANAIFEAYKVSKGAIICLLDSDDFFYSGKIEKVVETFVQHPNALMVQHIFDEVNHQGEFTGQMRPLLLDVPIQEYIYKENSLFYLFSSTSALAFKREFLNKNLPLTEDFSFLSPDVKLYLSSAVSGRVVTLHETLGAYRIHESNHSKMMRDTAKYQNFLKQSYQYFNRVAGKKDKKTIPQLDEDQILMLSPIAQQIDWDALRSFLREENSQVFIWGAGELGRVIETLIRKENINIIAFIDSDSRKKHSKLNQVEVIMPVDLINVSEGSKLIVAVYYGWENIFRYVESSQLFSKERILHPFKNTCFSGD